MNTRKQFYLSCLLLFSSVQIAFAMDDPMAGPSTRRAGKSPVKSIGDFGTEAVHERHAQLERAYLQSMAELVERNIHNEEFASKVVIINWINGALPGIIDAYERQGLLGQKLDAMRETVELARLLKEEDLLKQVREVMSDNAAQDTNIFAQANAADLPQVDEPQALIENNLVASQDQAQPAQLMHDQEIQTDISAVQDQDKALRVSKLLELAKQHPRITTGVALAATAGGAYLLRQPLAQIGAQAKNRAASIYSNLKSRIARDSNSSSIAQADKNKAIERIQEAVLKLMASMSDVQLKKPGVETLLVIAWQGRTAVLRNNEYFNSLLRPEQRELLSELLLIK